MRQFSLKFDAMSKRAKVGAALESLPVLAGRFWVRFRELSFQIVGPRALAMRGNKDGRFALKTRAKFIRVVPARSWLWMASISPSTKANFVCLVWAVGLWQIDAVQHDRGLRHAERRPLDA